MIKKQDGCGASGKYYFISDVGLTKKLKLVSPKYLWKCLFYSRD